MLYLVGNLKKTVTTSCPFQKISVIHMTNFGKVPCVFQYFEKKTQTLVFLQWRLTRTLSVTCAYGPQPLASIHINSEVLDPVMC